jgi:indoleacetamide hydrolase
LLRFGMGFLPTIVRVFFTGCLIRYDHDAPKRGGRQDSGKPGQATPGSMVPAPLRENDMTSRATVTDANLDRRAILKAAAGASAAVIAPHAPVSAAAPASNEDIVSLSARAAADYIRRGELSAERYAQVLLGRYKAHTNLNAVAHIDEAKLAEDARAVDRARATGAQLGPLAGLPIILKDNINTVGFPTTAGTAFLKGYRPKTNAPLADMLFKQGAILFAKSNMHELALGGTSANPTFGYVKNPYDLSRIPGGSSGGTAAVAARIVPLGIGSDTAGSVRMPAHFCGIAGLRPSNPKANKPYPVDGIVPLALAFDVAGPLARSVADVAFLHAAITHGPEPSPADLRGVRIGLPRNPFWEEIDADVAKIMEASLDRLRGAGAVLVDVDFGDVSKAALATSEALRIEGRRADLAAFLAQEYPAMTMKDAIAGIASKAVRALFEDARDHPPSREDVEKAQAGMDALGPQYREAFRQQNIVAIAYPTVPIPAPPLPTEGDALPASFEMHGRQFAGTVIPGNSRICPVYRAPGLSLPAGLTSDGLPVGLEIDGLPGGDDQLLRLGLGIEAVLGPLPPPTFRNS